MIYKLQGHVASYEDDHLIIDVNGIGYGVFCSSILINKYSNIGSKISLLIETYVREDSIKLFGFEDATEKKTFNIITKIPGVGAKMGVAILSHMTPSDISNAVMSEDKDSFKAISGVGPKLANRIVTELKGKLLKDLPKANTPLDTKFVNQNVNDNINDAVTAMENFGFSRSDAYGLMVKLKKEDPEIKLDEMIKSGLKQLGTR